MAQLGAPDMRLPIQLALTYPQRMESPAPKLDLTQCAALTFCHPDYEKFPCLALARDCAKRGGTACPAMNGANEEAVALFLADKPKLLAAVKCPSSWMKINRLNRIMPKMILNAVIKCLA